MQTLSFSTLPQAQGSKAAPTRIGLLGSFAPRQCGIATFTTDLCQSLAAAFPATSCTVVAINDTDPFYAYGKRVAFGLDRQDRAAYQRAADFLNSSGAEVVCLQHEFGVYGGPEGSHLLELLRRLKVPLVTTLHTVLTHPNDLQNQIMAELIERSEQLIVMTDYTRGLLCEHYQTPPAQVTVIPHGIPETPWPNKPAAKRRLGLEGRTLLLTFGLLSPGKGIEDALRGVAQVAAQFPDLLYVVLGATHPQIVREAGETYRQSLQQLAGELGIARNVQFMDRFVDLAELSLFLEAADLYITPYRNEAQAVSGTLAYAFGCGVPVISTPYWHARELLQAGRGWLVPFQDPSAIAAALRAALLDEPHRSAVGQANYRAGRRHVWSQAAAQFMNCFCEAAVVR